MKFPNTFRPEKSLDEKTQKLVEEAHLVNPDLMGGIFKSDVEILIQAYENLEYHKNDNFHKEVDGMIFARDFCIERNSSIMGIPPFYKSFKTFDHWSLPNQNEDAKYVLTRSYRKDNIIRYYHAKVPSNNLTKYMDELERYSFFESFIGPDKGMYKKMNLKLLGGYVTFTTLLGLLNGPLFSVGGFFLGFQIYYGGKFVLKNVAKQKQKSSLKKIQNLTDRFNTNDKGALVDAFK